MEEKLVKLQIFTPVFDETPFLDEEV